jgi:acetoin utilization protein AcuB
MLGDLTLRDLMIKEPITVSPDDEIELAARLIYQNKIGGMPVVKGDQLAGIITATDILRTFIDMMGILSSSSRIDVVIGERTGSLKEAIQIINDAGGDIINVGMTTQPTNRRIYHFRLSACKTAKIKKTLQRKNYQVLAAMD